MKLLPKLAALLALGLACGTASADTFNFSYLFADGLAVTGSLQGDESADGLFVENVSNVSVFFNGDAQAGASIFLFDGVGGYAAGGIVAFNALANNFTLANSDLAAADYGYTWNFFLLNASVYADVASAYSESLALTAQDDPILTANWSLTRATASVPDQGATLALLAFGLGALAWMNIRFRSRAT